MNKQELIALVKELLEEENLDDRANDLQLLRREYKYLLGRDEDTDLVGPDWSAHVKYWMPFAINGKIGMHDASWRTEFGGDIYKTAGSHGCVNLPEKLAETIFENIYVGFPIVVK